MISAKGLAPRAKACSSGSRISIAAPSPRTIPERLAEKGRQVSGLTTRIASPAFNPPRKKGVALPPAMPKGAAPERTIQYALAMAWAEEEQAVEKVYAGPCR